MAIDWTKADRIEVGQKIAAARLAREWTVEEASRRANGMSPTTWNRIEKGVERSYDVKISQAATALGIVLTLPLTSGETVEIGKKSEAVDMVERLDRIAATSERTADQLAELAALVRRLAGGLDDDDENPESTGVTA